MVLAAVTCVGVFYKAAFFNNSSSKNPEEAELEDTLNQVVRCLMIPFSVATYLTSCFRLFVEGA